MSKIKEAILDEAIPFVYGEAPLIWDDECYPVTEDDVIAIRLRDKQEQVEELREFLSTYYS
jgi:hypothetical protein